MRSTNELVLIILAVVTSLITLAIILAAVFLDVGGWGGFVLDLLLSAIVQGLLAALLLGLILALLVILFRPFFPFFVSRGVIAIMFLGTAIMALSFIPQIFNRGLDLYDYVTTLLLAGFFAFLVDPLKQVASRIVDLGYRRALPPAPASPQPYQTPPGFQPIEAQEEDPASQFQAIRRPPPIPSSDLSDLLDEEDELSSYPDAGQDYDQGYEEPPSESYIQTPLPSSPMRPAYSEPPRYTSPTSPPTPTGAGPDRRSMSEVQLYNELLKREGGNHIAAQRRVAFEYGLKPDSTREELLRSALDRWDQEHQGQ